MKLHPFLFIMLLSCGQPVQTAARQALEQSARSLITFDELTAQAYRDNSAQALEATDSLEEYQRSLAPWDNLEATLRRENKFLLDARSGLFRWELHGESDEFKEAMTCVAVYMKKILEQMTSLHIGYEVLVADTVTDALSNWSLGECHEQ